MNEHQKYLIDEFSDEWRDRRISRRELFRRVFLITGSIAITSSTLISLGCGDDDDEDAAEPTRDAESPIREPGPSPSATANGGSEIETRDLRFPGPASDLLGYLAEPAGTGTHPGILVIHENRGLNDHIRDVARRLARSGFAALAVDLVSRAGGSQSDTTQNTGFLGRSRPEDLIADLVAYAQHLEGLAAVRPGLGVTGFCFGGGYAWEAAVAIPGLRAAVPFYGTCRVIDRLAESNAAILAIYGERDTRITSQAEAVREALQTAGKTFDIMIYEGASHAFFNDTGTNYHAAAAADAWARTLSWFSEHLPAY